jgi:uncharacterized protein (TIGR00251 family)
MTRLGIKVVPGASTSEIVGWLGDDLKIRISQPPEKGKANRAVETLMCRALGIRAGAVRIIRGGTSSHKVLEIKGLSLAEIRAKLAAS